jgi:urea carboxylase
VEFNLKEHNQLLRDTKEEVAKIRAEQREAQAKLDKKKEMLEKWAREKEAGKISMDAVEELLNGKHTILFSLDCIADFNEIPASY